MLNRAKERIEAIVAIMQSGEFNAEELRELNQTLHSDLLDIHARALACHCQCLGMNSENCRIAAQGGMPYYPDDAYKAAMVKWGLINEKGEPLI